MQQPEGSGEIRRVNYASVEGRPPIPDIGTRLEIPEYLRPRQYPAYRREPEGEVAFPFISAIPVVANVELALWLADLRVYPSGLAFRLEGRLADPTGRSTRTASGGGMNLGRGAKPNQVAPIRIVVELPDGTAVSNSTKSRDVPEERSIPWLHGSHSYASSAGGGGMLANYFLSPLPARGPLAIVIAYPELGIEEIRIDIDATTLPHALAEVADRRAE
jgi:hypothetical protein